MDTLDLPTLFQRLVQLRLATDAQVQEAREELQIPNPLPEAVLHVLERKGHLTPWQSAKLLKGDEDGYFLGGYKILYKVASGASAASSGPRTRATAASWRSRCCGGAGARTSSASICSSARAGSASR